MSGHRAATRTQRFAEYLPPRAASPLERATAGFAPVTLAQLGKAALMDRVDTKFLLPAAALPQVLQQFLTEYRALEVAQRRLSQYHTLYFDTPDLALYRAHHDGRFPRRKVRVRTYLDTGTQFLELKVKLNTGRAVKTRVPLDPDAPLRDQLVRSELLENEGMTADALRETVTVRYSRMTLVSVATAERVTLDLGLELAMGGRTRSYPHLAIAEVKQEGRAASPFLSAMRSAGFRQFGVSKYCLGIASLDAQAKKNLYKQLLRQVDRTATSHPVTP